MDGVLPARARARRLAGRADALRLLPSSSIHRTTLHAPHAHDQTPSRRPPARTGAGIATAVALIIALVLTLRQQNAPPAAGPAAPTSAASRSAAATDAPGTSPGVTDRTPRPEPDQSTPPRATRPDAPAPEPAEHSGSARSREPAHVAPSEIRIGTWNIEWLGKPNQRSGPARGVPQTPDDLADYIVASRVSVLALQEIVAQPGLPPRSRELDEAFAALARRTGERWVYTLFEGRGRGDGDDQLTGLAWNPALVTPIDAKGRAVEPQAAAWPVPVQSGRSAQGSGLWNRPPNAVKFTAGDGLTDFALIVIHMKADYEGDFAAHRAEEAQRLAEALPAASRAFTEHDVVVLGDTNMTAPAEPARGAFERAGLADLNAKSETTHWRGGATDRIFAPASQPEFAERRFEVMSDRYLDPKRWDPREFKRRLSDHYMAITTVRIMPDDD